MVATKQTDWKASTVSELMASGAARCHDRSSYCARCDLLVGLAGVHVIAVRHDPHVGVLEVTVESPPAVRGCGDCGVVAHSHGHRDVTLVDVPCFGRPVRSVLRKRTWRCGETLCDLTPGADGKPRARLLDLPRRPRVRSRLAARVLVSLSPIASRDRPVSVRR